MTKQTMLTFGLAVLLTGTLAFAQGPGGPPPMGPGGGHGGRRMVARGHGGPGGLMSPMLAKALNVTDQQKEAIRAEMKASREAAKPIAEQLRDLRTQIEDAVHSGNEAALTSLAAQSGTLQGELMAISLKSRSKIYNTILTAEQRTKAEELRNEMKERIENRRNRKAPPAGAPAPQAGF